MSAFSWGGITLVVLNCALALIVFVSLPIALKRQQGVAPSLIYLLATAATVVWMWRALQWLV